MVDIPVNNEDPGSRQHGAHKGKGLPPPGQWSPGWERLGGVSAKALPSGSTPCNQPCTHLCSPCFCWACLAAMATLLNTQNPLAAALWLWCPGGLCVRAGRGARQRHPVPIRGGSPGGGTALTSPGQAHCAQFLSVLHPPAAAQPPRPAGHSGRYSVGARVQMSPPPLPPRLCPGLCQATGHQALSGMGQDSPRCQQPQPAGVQGIGTSMNSGTLARSVSRGREQACVSGWVAVSPGHAPDGSRWHHTVQTVPGAPPCPRPGSPATGPRTRGCRGAGRQGRVTGRKGEEDWTPGGTAHLIARSSALPMVKLKHIGERHSLQGTGRSREAQVPG